MLAMGTHRHQPLSQGQNQRAKIWALKNAQKKSKVPVQQVDQEVCGMHEEPYQEHIKDELESLKDQVICEELAREWDDLKFQFGLDLKKPSLGLLSSEARLGEWDPTARSIRLSRSAVRSLSWDTVVSILKHEVAHQMVTETYGVDEQHGPSFQRACDRIGLLPQFRRCALNLDEARESEQRPSTLPPRLVRRMERLEALALSTNQHESELALRLLQEMQSQTFSSGWQADPFNRLVISLGRKRVSQEQSIIAGILAAHFEVDVVFSSTFCTRQLERRKTLVVLGRSHHAEMAEYVFHFLQREIRSLWESHARGASGTPPSPTESRSLRTSFQVGVLKGFERKLSRQRAQTREQQTNPGQPPGSKRTRADEFLRRDAPWDQTGQPESMAPSAQSWGLSEQARRNELRQRQQFLESQFPRLVSRSHSARVADGASMRAGQRAGEALSLKRPIAQPSAGPTRRLRG